MQKKIFFILNRLPSEVRERNVVKSQVQIIFENVNLPVFFCYLHSFLFNSPSRQAQMEQQRRVKAVTSRKITIRPRFISHSSDVFQC